MMLDARAAAEEDSHEVVGSLEGGDKGAGTGAAPANKEVHTASQPAS